MPETDDQLAERLRRIKGESAAIQAQDLKSAMETGMDFDPDQRAKNIRTANTLGVHPDIVEDDAPTFEKTLQKINFRSEDYLKKNPKSAAFYASNPMNAQVGWDDRGVLGNIEQSHAKMIEDENAKSGRGFLTGIGASLAETGARLLAIPSDMFDAATRMAYKDEKKRSRIFGSFEPALTPFKAAKGAADWFGSKKRATESVLIDDGNGGKLLHLNAINPLRAAGAENIVNIVASEAIPMIATYAVGLFTAPETGGASLEAAALANAGRFSKLSKFVKAAASYARSPVGVLNSARVIQGQYDEGVKDLMAKDPTLSMDAAKAKVAPGAILAGVLSPVFGGVMETKIIEGWAHTLSKSPVGYTIGQKILNRLQSFAVQGSKEMAQEAIEGIGEDLSAWMTYQPDKTMKDVAGNMIMNAVGGLFVGGSMGAAIHGSRAENQATQREFFDSLNKGAVDSKLVERMPESFRDAINGIVKDGPVESVGVPIQRWVEYMQQAGENPQSFAESVGVDTVAYHDALSAGGDIIIKTSDFASHIAGTDHYDGIINDVRFTPLGETIRESNERKSVDAAEVQRLVDSFKEDESNPVSLLQQELKSQLIAGHRGDAVTPAQAEAEAELFGYGIARLATRAKMDISAFLETYPLTIENGKPRMEQLKVPPSLVSVDAVSNAVDKARSAMLEPAPDATTPQQIDEPTQKIIDTLKDLGIDPKTMDNAQVESVLRNHPEQSKVIAFRDSVSKEDVYLEDGTVDANIIADRIANALKDVDGPSPDAEVVVGMTLNQVQNLPEWKLKVQTWMQAQRYSPEEVTKHLRSIEGQMAIFSALGPVQLEMLPTGDGENPVRTNQDFIYKFSFDLSSMCVKRLDAQATETAIRERLGRALSTSERMALVAMFRAEGKEAPCLYCYVEAPRAKASEFVRKAQEVLSGAMAMPPLKKSESSPGWAQSTIDEATAAKAEYEALSLTGAEVAALVNSVIDPKYADGMNEEETDRLERLQIRAAKVHEFLSKQFLNAKSNLPKLYAEYKGQILDIPTETINELNGYAGFRFFSSSDFQPEHVVDLLQAVNDLSIKKAKAHAYTKVKEFVEIFGGTGMKINTSIFAVHDPITGAIVPDTQQGMDWEVAKGFRERFPNVGTIIVATSDEIAQWGREQPWIDFVIPFHHSGMEGKFTDQSGLGYMDFTGTQDEEAIDPKSLPKPVIESVDGGFSVSVDGQSLGIYKTKKSAKEAAKDLGVRKVRMHELGVHEGQSDEQTTRNYLEICMKRKIVPVFPSLLFKDFQPVTAAIAREANQNRVDAKGNPLAPLNRTDQQLVMALRGERTKQAKARWAAMVDKGEIAWDEIAPGFAKFKKDYARTDTPFTQVDNTAIDMSKAEGVLNSYFDGTAPTSNIQADLGITQKMIDTINAYRGRESELDAASIYSIKNKTEFGVMSLTGPTGGVTQVYNQSGVEVKSPDQILAEAKVIFENPATEEAYNALKDVKGKNITKGGAVLNVDYARHLDPNFKLNPNGTVPHHHAAVSAFIKNLVFKRAAMPVAPGGREDFVFLAGGGGSGKGTVSDKYHLEDNAHTVVDGTLKKFSEAVKMIDAVLKGGRNVRIDWIYRPVAGAVGGNITRGHENENEGGRFVGLDQLVSAHEGSPETIRDLINHYRNNPSVKINAYSNAGGLNDVYQIPDGNVESFVNSHLETRGNLADQALEAYNKIKEVGYESYKFPGTRQPVTEDARAFLDESARPLAGQASVEWLRSLYGGGKPEARGVDSQGPQGRTAGAGGQVVYSQGPRARLKIGENHEMRLEFLQTANISSAAHEFGHFYLEVMRDLASKSGVDPQIKEDYETILREFGDVDKDGNRFISEATHERFADGHLLWLKEGNAPSASLMPAFSRFSTWLTKIWSTITSGMVDVKINDELRGVYNRLYASETETENALAIAGLGKPMFTTATQMGKSQAEFDLLVEASSKVAADGKLALMKHLMAELERNTSRERKAFYQNAFDNAKKALASTPPYRALLTITESGSGLKMSKKAIEEMGVDPSKLVAHGIQTVFSENATNHPDVVAELLVDANGEPLFGSGSELLKALTDIPRLSKASEAVASEVTSKSYPDSMSDPEAMQQVALEAMSNSENIGKVMAIEYRALRDAEIAAKPLVELERKVQEAKSEDERQKAQEAFEAYKASKDQERKSDASRAKQASALPDMKASREAAIRILSRVNAFEINPYRYLQARLKASNEAAKAFAKKDYAKAAEAKQSEMLNHFLYSEALKAQEEVDAFVKFDKEFDTKAKRQSIGKAGGSFLWQIDQLRLRFGLSTFQGESLIENQQSLAEWIKDNEFAEVDDRFVDPRFSKDYQTMTLEEIRALSDTLHNIRALANLETKIAVGGKRVDLQDAADELVASIRKHNTTKRVTRTSEDHGATLKEKAVNSLMGWDAMMIKMELLVNFMDGGDVNGPAHRYIWNPLAEAQTVRYQATIDIVRPLQEAFYAMPEEQRKNLDQKIVVDGFDTTLSRREILTMLFNMGNDVNQDKLMRGYGWNESQLASAMKHLTKADAEFVQNTWNTIEKMWPAMVALEKRSTGIEPKKQDVRQLTIETKDGAVTLDGGYWPLVADPKGTKNQKAIAKPGEVDKILPESSARPGTSRSAVKERTGATYELLLDFQSVMTSHINGVVMDLSHREAIHAADKITSRPEVVAAIQEAFGPEYYRQIKPWLKTIVGDGNTAAAKGIDTFHRFIGGMKSNAVAAALGFKVSSAVVQFADITRVLGPGDYRVKTGYFAESFLRFVTNPKEVIKHVRELSGEMRHRPENLDRDIREMLNQMTGQQTIKSRWNRAAFKMLAFMDTWISITTWDGAFKQAMADHGDADRAILEADRTVRLKLMSSNPKDLVAVQRNDGLMRLVTMYMGDMSAGYNMMRNAGHKAKGLGGFVTQFTPAAMTIMMGAIIGDLLKGQWPDEDEEGKRKWKNWTMSRVATAPFQTVPFLRDAVRALDGKVQGKPFSDYQFSPAFGAINKAIAAIDITADMLGSEKEVDKVDWAVKTGDAVASAFGVAGEAQAASMIKYMRRVDKGEEELTVGGVILPQPRKGIQR